MAVVLPVLTALAVLGTSFDLRTYDMGKQFFNETDYETVKVNNMNASYLVLPQDSFPYEYFGVPPGIALQAKYNTDGKFNNLRYLVTASSADSVTVVIRFNYKSVDRTLKKDARIIDEKRPFGTESPTHYVSSLNYGGYSMVFFRFRCQLEHDVPNVRRVLTSILGNEGDINPETVVAWKKAMKALDKYAKGHVSTDVSTYSNVHELKLDVKNADNWVKIATDLPKAIKGDGHPLSMSLSSLHDVDSKYPLVEVNIEEANNLEKVNQLLGDVVKTNDAMLSWQRSTQTLFDDNQEEMISKVMQSLKNSRLSLLPVALEASSFKSTDQKVFEKCFEVYHDGLDAGSFTYYMNYKRLREQIDAHCENAFEDAVRGLLRVNSTEFINLDEVEGGLEQCKTECFSRPQCRAIFYVGKIDVVEAVADMSVLVTQQKQCQIYFRSTNTADVLVPQWLPSDAAIYDRKCK